MSEPRCEFHRWRWDPVEKRWLCAVCKAEGEYYRLTRYLSAAEKPEGD